MADSWDSDVCRTEQPRWMPGFYHPLRTGKDITMLSTIALVLLVLWLLGVLTSYTIGGFIHILLVVAVVAVLLRVIQGRSPLLG
jgi:hypothetical protein